MPSPYRSPTRQDFPSPPPSTSPPLLIDGIEMLPKGQGHLGLDREHPVPVREPVPHILDDPAVRLPEKLAHVIRKMEVQGVLVMVRMLEEKLPVGLRTGHPLREERRDTAGPVERHHVKVADETLRGIGQDVCRLFRTKPVHTSLDVWAIVAIVRGISDCLCPSMSIIRYLSSSSEIYYFGYSFQTLFLLIISHHST